MINDIAMIFANSWFAKQKDDMAGSWVAMKLFGVEFRDYVSGDLVEKLDSRWFDEKLKIKNLQIVSREKDFEHLREIVELRKKAAI